MTNIYIYTCNKKLYLTKDRFLKIGILRGEQSRATEETREKRSDRARSGSTEFPRKETIRKRGEKSLLYFLSASKLRSLYRSPAVLGPQDRALRPTRVRCDSRAFRSSRLLPRRAKDPSPFFTVSHLCISPHCSKAQKEYDPSRKRSHPLSRPKPNESESLPPDASTHPLSPSPPLSPLTLTRSIAPAPSLRPALEA